MTSGSPLATRSPSGICSKVETSSAADARTTTEGTLGQLEDQVAIVTGGGSGIGRGVVDRYVEEGARVAVVDIAPERLDDVRAQHGERVIGIAADVTKIEDNQRA